MSEERLDLSTLLAGTDETWRDQALCAQADPEAFFPEKGGSTRSAKSICDACEVRAECLDYALEHEERFGIWGGLSDRERRDLRQMLEAEMPALPTQAERTPTPLTPTSPAADGPAHHERGGTAA